MDATESLTPINQPAPDDEVASAFLSMYDVLNTGPNQESMSALNGKADARPSEAVPAVQPIVQPESQPLRGTMRPILNSMDSGLVFDKAGAAAGHFSANSKLGETPPEGAAEGVVGEVSGGGAAAMGLEAAAALVGAARGAAQGEPRVPALIIGINNQEGGGEAVPASAAVITPVEGDSAAAPAGAAEAASHHPHSTRKRGNSLGAAPAASASGAGWEDSVGGRGEEGRAGGLGFGGMGQGGGAGGAVQGRVHAVPSNQLSGLAELSPLVSCT